MKCPTKLRLESPNNQRGHTLNNSSVTRIVPKASPTWDPFVSHILLQVIENFGPAQSLHPRKHSQLMFTAG